MSLTVHGVGPEVTGDMAHAETHFHSRTSYSCNVGQTTQKTVCTHAVRLRTAPALNLATSGAHKCSPWPSCRSLAPVSCHAAVVFHLARARMCALLRWLRLGHRLTLLHVACTSHASTAAARLASVAAGQLIDRRLASQAHRCGAVVARSWRRGHGGAVMAAQSRRVLVASDPAGEREGQGKEWRKTRRTNSTPTKRA